MVTLSPLANIPSFLSTFQGYSLLIADNDLVISTNAIKIPSFSPGLSQQSEEKKKISSMVPWTILRFCRNIISYMFDFIEY